MPPTLEKLKGHIAFGASVHLSVCPCARSKFMKDTVLKFHIWIPLQKIIDKYFFLSLDYLPCGVMPLLKGHNDIL